ncbi:MAG: hypothetical protein DI573_09755 [Microbacterium sp.]|uniref:hypothetical protein n=1 Tax=unclassified Microbacterium TaxID=2609290 RepID=UPI000DB79E8F|nr:hypothetical protein [Microbacterium sp.]PZU38461.1 MAG: hypothetical protein DI573_09755 [Microbacterium sp.]
MGRRRSGAARTNVGIAVALVAAGALALGTAEIVSSTRSSAASCVAGEGAAASIAGYRGVQLENAAAIMDAATAVGFGADAQVLGVMAAMGESGLRNIDYGDWETSGVRNPDGSRTTSIGLFQQQEGWGSVDERMDPSRSATLFFARLAEVEGWQDMKPTRAIHAVQINADPHHYARWERSARAVVEGLSPGGCGAR